MNKRWKLLPQAEESTKQLASELKIDPSICRILVQRGVDSFEKARSYFRPGLSELHDPWMMKGMEAAVSRIQQAIENQEKILVYGDYDVDGTTSVACMVHFMRRLMQPAYLDYYIPHRYREGYGISGQGVDFAIEKGYSLVIALDCGIKSCALIGYAKEKGIDFIICDHHLPGAELPVAVAILNPKQQDCNYPYKDLCGCGVGFKLISALAERFAISMDEVYVYLDLVATAIAADIVPMTGENRILAFFGLDRANKLPNPGIAALKELSSFSGDMSISNLVFMIAPRVNAAGRMDDARKAVQLFLSESKDEALYYAEQLHIDNDERKAADQIITKEALALIESDSTFPNRKTTVVYQPHWHKGVVGIVASRLTEYYYRPTVVLTRSGDQLAGSARSVAGFNLYEAIDACGTHLSAYGGHFAAAGLSMHPDQLENFREAFEKVAAEKLTEEQLTPELLINLEINLDQIQPSFYRILAQMEPFGPENMRPVFLSRNVQDTGYSSVLKEQHLKLVVKQGGKTMTGIFFRGAHFYPIVQQAPFDIVFTLEENEYRGTRTLQLHILDIRPT
jgi:single-stranded-DNA-specific exonuclease